MTLWAQHHLVVSFPLVSLGRAGAPRQEKSSFQSKNRPRRGESCPLKQSAMKEQGFPLTTRPGCVPLFLPGPGTAGVGL